MEIFIIDNLSPEDVAMLQSLYSRSPKTVTKHLEEIRKGGSSKFMDKFYVGYGHKSIGDCGTTTLCIEQVSMLAAKAIQSSALYNGQEASTRYMDMSKQEILNPLGSIEGMTIQKHWMDMYEYALAELKISIANKFPIQEGEDSVIWRKSVDARAFDVARGLLPAGATTLVSMHTNLRQAYDHLHRLMHHPLLEISVMAKEILTELKRKYPSSFGHKTYPDQEDYLEEEMESTTYVHDPCITSFSYESHLRLESIPSGHFKLLELRPQKTELAPIFRKYGELSFRFPLDFGSFRDLQRQRSCVLEMPLLTTEMGFHEWYLESMPEELRGFIQEGLEMQEKRLKSLDIDEAVKQYYIAMGYKVSCDMTANLPSAIYISELRSGQTVHPTLRVIAQQMGRALSTEIPTIKLHCDYNPDTWSIKRGTQDIVKKKELA